MRIITLIIYILGSSLFISCKPEPVIHEKPNLVLIITDDQGYGDLGIHGNPILDTPHLDRIGREGTRLDNFHVSPVCAPTRAAVLTGRRPMSTGTHGVTRGAECMDAGEYTLAEILGDAGYSSACIGKWHNGAHHPNHPLGQGFDEFFGFTAGHWNNYFDPVLEDNGMMVPTKGYITDVLTDRALEFIREKKEEPFFCYLAYNAPHSPFQVPDPYFDKYMERVEEEDPSLQIMNACVYGMVENIDHNVGRIISQLEALDIDRHTIVLFMTDNGPNTWRFNGEMKGKKAWVNDGGVRVPCFIRWKGHIPQEKVLDAMTAHIDLLPTLCGLMEVDFKPEREIHGLDLSSYIMGEEQPGDRFLFTHLHNAGNPLPWPGAIRSEEWRLCCKGQAEDAELTRRSDLREAEDLAGIRPELVDSLEKTYLEWFDSVKSVDIKPIAVGVIDSVILPGHEAFTSGNARYFWSENGWSNDWLTGMDTDSSCVHWNLDVRRSGDYECWIRYASTTSPVRIIAEVQDQELEGAFPVYVPVREKNHSRIDRPAEAIGQSWNRVSMGKLSLTEGPARLRLSASEKEAEILEAILLIK